MSALANSQLWFSEIQAFNDPFEGMFILDDSLSEEVLKLWKNSASWKPDSEINVADRDTKLRQLGLNKHDYTKEEFVKALAMDELDIIVSLVRMSKIVSMSLSDRENDPITENLMWSHYADGLRGFCLVFSSEQLQRDINESSDRVMRPIKVMYQNKPNALRLSDFLSSETVLGDSEIDYIEHVIQTVATKSKSWKYENEMRILSMSESNMHSYTSSALSEIVIGDKMPLDQQKLVIHTAKMANPDIIVRRAKLKKNSYVIEIKGY